MNLTVTHTARHPRRAWSMSDAGRRVVVFCAGWILRRIDNHLCPPGRLPVHGIHRVLVVRPNHRLGNMVLITPLLDEIQAIYPGAEVDMVGAGRAARMLFSTRFQLYRVVSLPRLMVRHPLASMACLRELRATHYDLAIDPCVASNSGHLVLGMCKAGYKVGFASNLALDTLCEHNPGLPAHMAKRGVYVLRKALANATRTQWPPLNMRLTSAELERGRCALERILGSRSGPGDPERPILGVFTHATGNKRLPEAWWRALLARLQTTRPDVCIVEVLAEHGRSQLAGVMTSFYTRDLRKLAAVLANMQGFVSADGGVMHLATAVGTPTLGLFTRANRARYTPYGEGNSGLNVASDAVGGDGNGTSTAHLSVMEWVRQVMVPESDASARMFADRDVSRSTSSWRSA